MNDLERFGWHADFDAAFALHGCDGQVPGRVIREQRDLLDVLTRAGTVRARIAGRLRHKGFGIADRAAVGDWVLLEPPTDRGSIGVVHGVLPRRSAIIRRAASLRVQAQVVAANVDTVLLVTSLNRDFNPRRIERYLALIAESGAAPVLLLNKLDLCDDLDAAWERAEAVASGAPIHAIAALTGAGFDVLAQYLRPGETTAVIGSSGVGKSTLINRILGEDVQLVREIRTSDDRGRHTTTSRELLPVPDGGLLVDTPGMRELGLWAGDHGVAGAFRDVESLVASCRFRDCRHDQEPGCAVRAAVEAGTLDPARLASYEKLQRELAFVARKQDTKAAREHHRDRMRQARVRSRALRRDPRLRTKRGR